MLGLNFALSFVLKLSYNQSECIILSKHNNAMLKLFITSAPVFIHFWTKSKHVFVLLTLIYLTPFG